MFVKMRLQRYEKMFVFRLLCFVFMSLINFN